MPQTYLEQASSFGTSTRLLVDRNILSRWVAIVRGSPNLTTEHRLAAAILAFSQCAGIDVEPSLALYEVAQRQGSETAHNELRDFRLADATHPGYWADVALSRASSVIPPDDIRLQAADVEIDFGMPLRRWRRNYVLALKLAELELEGGPPAARMSRFMMWMYQDFLLAGPAFALAAMYLAPNYRRKGLLRRIYSADRERALEGIRNAAWDLTLVSEWQRFCREQRSSSRLTLLASLDRGVHSFARFVSDIENTEGSKKSRTIALLTALWGESLGRQIATQIADHDAQRGAAHRTINQEAEPGFIDGCIALGEEKVRAWTPRGMSSPNGE